MTENARRPMTDAQRRQAAKHFAEYWQGKGYEKGESQKFWLSLLGAFFPKSGEAQKRRKNVMRKALFS